MIIDWSIPRLVEIPPASIHNEDDVKDWSAIGRIYEHLACYYLSSIGFKAEVRDAAGYDILAECPDGKFFKVEVKSSTPRNNKSRTKQDISFSGMRNKAVSDLFMFFDRNTNHMVIKFAEEIDFSRHTIYFTTLCFSDYHTQASLAKLTSYIPDNKLSYVAPSAEEETQLNRNWVLDNMDVVHEMRSAGVWTSSINKMFGLSSYTGKNSWLHRICREDRKRITGIIK
jgi:hypothetical protein